MFTSDANGGIVLCYMLTNKYKLCLLRSHICEIKKSFAILSRQDSHSTLDFQRITGKLCCISFDAPQRS